MPPLILDADCGVLTNVEVYNMMREYYFGQLASEKSVPPPCEACAQGLIACFQPWVGHFTEATLKKTLDFLNQHDVPPDGCLAILNSIPLSPLELYLCLGPQWVESHLTEEQEIEFIQELMRINGKARADRDKLMEDYVNDSDSNPDEEATESSASASSSAPDESELDELEAQGKAAAARIEKAALQASGMIGGDVVAAGSDGAASDDQKAAFS